MTQTEKRSDWTLKPSSCVRGAITVPGDKSISHRAVLFGSLAEGTTTVTGLLEGEDVLSTVAAMKEMGVKVVKKGKVWKITGRGIAGLKTPKNILDCGNSGTTMRLLIGLLSGSGVTASLTGDASLNRRPMARVIEPLKSMGADVRELTNDRMHIRIIEVHGKKLTSKTFRIPMASAQVKSALLLAGLASGVPVRVTEPAQSRDHTERMLKAFGVRVTVKGRTAGVLPAKKLKAQKILVPGDISSAAFFLVLGLIAPIDSASKILLKNVGLNPTRTGILDVLKKMGGKIRVLRKRTLSGEVVGDLEVRPSKLKGVTIGGAMIPRLIDEIPILSVAAAMAHGQTLIKDAKELRVKETDRIAALCRELPKFGVRVEEKDDGLVIHGIRGIRGLENGKPQGAEGESYGDHRMAMSLAVLSSVCEGPTVIRNTDCVETSFPGFLPQLRRVQRGF